VENWKDCYLIDANVNNLNAIALVSEGRYAQPIAEFRQQHYNAGLFRQLSGPVENGDGHAEAGTAETGKNGKKK
jgi:hypothetical protein